MAISLGRIVGRRVSARSFPGGSRAYAGIPASADRDAFLLHLAGFGALVLSCLAVRLGAQRLFAKYGRKTAKERGEDFKTLFEVEREKAFQETLAEGEKEEETLKWGPRI